MGVSDEIIERILNHAPRTVTGRHYNHARYLSQMRQALEAWSERLRECIQGRVSAAAQRLGLKWGAHTLRNWVAAHRRDIASDDAASWDEMRWEGRVATIVGDALYPPDRSGKRRRCAARASGASKQAALREIERQACRTLADAVLENIAQDS